MRLFSSRRLFARRPRASAAVILAVVATAAAGFIVYGLQDDGAPYCDQQAVQAQLRDFLTRATRERHPRSIDLQDIRETDSQAAGVYTVGRSCTAVAVVDFTVIEITYEIEREGDSQSYHVVLHGP